jgi:hypothetical protein
MDYIYVVVDRLTKYAHLFNIPSECSASQITYLFFKEVFILHVLPWNIVNYRDSRFLMHFGRSCLGYPGHS